MTVRWTLELKSPKKVIRDHLRKAWQRSLDRLELYLRNRLVPALVDGGLGINGIASTEMYQFITSPEGLSQLGIEPSEPPKLLEAYKKTFKVIRRGNIIELKFGNVARLKAGTLHPADGTGQLKIDSWLTWIVDRRIEPKGYVSRQTIQQSDLPESRKTKLESYIRLGGSLGGLMLDRKFLGSKGYWQIPERFRGYDVKWLAQNRGKIESLIADEAFKILQRELR